MGTRDYQQHTKKPNAKPLAVASSKLPCYDIFMNTLSGLLNAIGIEEAQLAQTQLINKICYNSEECVEASVFFAFPGLHTQGDLYIDDAIDKGAVCIFSTRPVANKQKHVLYFVTKTPRPLFSRMCAAFYNWPSRSLEVIGVTGTDGKSTTCDYLYQMLQEKGCKVGLLGTVSMDDGEGKRPSPYRQSTPEADQLQAFLSRCKRHNLTHVILECTSHALSKEYDRLATIEFALALVTTISSEHLEFHKSQEAYVAAKCNLVRALQPGGAFLTTRQNPYRAMFLSELPPFSYSHLLEKTLPFTTTTSEEGTVSVQYNQTTVRTPLALPCLASNAMLALLACSLVLHEQAEDLFPLLAKLTPVAGRMITVENRLGLRIIIDFAHTADAYEHIFSQMQAKKKGKIIAVFGAAGERDTTKRSDMGRIAARYADRIILTEEDPRNEPNNVIFGHIRSQMGTSVAIIEEIEDRTTAIQRAFEVAQEGDTLLFLGKGHETSIEGKEGKRPWNEEETVRSLLHQREGERL
ncbi:MAG: UDP-N-acetylmuramyl-tripeptide synthetase [Sphaerochaeta sp.]|nr:UDP-N-acetylmuramyl-tripeptide synthetase [Sphaerochaeta sp.]